MKLLAILATIPLLLGFGDSPTEDKVLNKKSVEDNSPAPIVSVIDEPNVLVAYHFLTGEGIVKSSRGRLKSMTAESAAGLIGNWIVETGSHDLTKLDVVEYAGGAGRGMSQYTSVRRWPYDQARLLHLREGGDPNCIDFQLNYFVEEYIGLHDPSPGKSLIGWSHSLERYSKMSSPELAAEAFSRAYFRPSRPHNSRRRYEARRIYNLVQHLILTADDPNSRRTESLSRVS
jgi:hypothetical protein